MIHVGSIFTDNHELSNMAVAAYERRWECFRNI